MFSECVCCCAGLFFLSGFLARIDLALWVGLGFYWVISSGTFGLYWVLLGCSGLHMALLGCTVLSLGFIVFISRENFFGMLSFFPSFTGFYWILLSFY